MSEQSKSYVGYYKRLTDFLAAFPIHAGWQRICEPVDPFDIVPHLKDDYQAYASSRREAGETPYKLVAFRAKLINPTGKVSLQVHKLGLAEQFKDVGTIETAAMNRLLAHSGFGSDHQDDESREFDLVQRDLLADRGEAPSNKRSDSGSVRVTVRPRAPSVSIQPDIQTTHRSVPDDERVRKSTSAQSAKPSERDPASCSDAPPSGFADDAISSPESEMRVLLQTIQALEEQKGIKPTTPSTFDEAEARLSELLTD